MDRSVDDFYFCMGFHVSVLSSFDCLEDSDNRIGDQLIPLNFLTLIAKEKG